MRIKARPRGVVLVAMGMPLLLLAAGCGSSGPAKTSATPSASASPTAASVPCPPIGGATSGGGTVASSGSAAGTPAGSTVPAAQLPTVSGNFGEPATITFPKGVKPAAGVQVKVVKQGAGSPVAKGQVASFSYTMADWTTGKSLGSSYSQSVPEPVTSAIPNSQIPHAWNTAVQNQHVGSRVLLVTPASQVFTGGKGDQQDGIGATDILVFALDIASAYNGTADISGKQPTMTDAKLPTVTVDPGKGTPKVAIPSGAKPPTALTCQTLIKGTGPTVRAGQNLTVQYDGVLWRDGTSFDSSFSRKQPTSFYIGVGGVVPGWDKTLVGRPVGSRVLLVLPPADGYGTSGNAQAGIKGTDTLVFVVDIMSAA